MGRKETLIEDRIITSSVGLTASVMVAENLWEKFSCNLEFEVRDGDDIDDLMDQASAKVENYIQAEVDEAFQQAREMRRERAGR